MLVTDVGGLMCQRQFSDVDDGFGRFGLTVTSPTVHLSPTFFVATGQKLLQATLPLNYVTLR